MWYECLVFFNVDLLNFLKYVEVGECLFKIFYLKFGDEMVFVFCFLECIVGIIYMIFVGV